MSDSYNISDFQTLTAVNEAHGVFLVKHTGSNKIFVKKVLEIYNPDIYKKLMDSPIPGTPRIICLEEHDGELVLIESFVSGYSLEELIAAPEDNDDASAIRADALSIDGIVGIALDICSVLEKLHALNPPVIHRDIKPSNIIITETGDAVLLDFNAAKKYTPGASSDTNLLGTRGYAAPEQYGFGSSSPQTDIYALGVVLKEMLASSPDSSDELSAIAEKCSMLDPKDRYPDVASLMADISRIRLSSGRKGSSVYSKKFSSYRSRIGAGTSGNITTGITSFFPPGFRSLSPWKMALSFSYYTIMALLCFSLESDNIKGSAIWCYRLLAYLLFVVPVFTIFNYRGMLNRLPLCNSRNIFL